ncbi:MAG: hypothetical protein L3J19_08200 [Sulfurimonas sp.]|nr:hypothetical protein [Sulfurimonas sp.]
MLKKYFALMVVSLLTITTLHAAPGAPFLILGKIPHYTGTIKANWDNKELNFTQQQREKLLKVRKDTLRIVMGLKKKLALLEKEVAEKIMSGSKPKELFDIVNKIAKYKIKATKAHLKCVYRTKKILTKEQLEVLDEL